MTAHLVQDRPATSHAGPAVRRRSTPQSIAADTWRWINQVEELGEPRFGELGLLLHCLREAVDAQSRASLATSARGSADHGIANRNRCVDRLDLLIARLEHPDRYFGTWQQACREFEEIWDEYSD